MLTGTGHYLHFLKTKETVTPKGEKKLTADRWSCPATVLPAMIEALRLLLEEIEAY